MTTPTVDASGVVARVMGDARRAIGEILRQVTGNPEAVLDAEAAYRAGNGAVTSVTKRMDAIGSTLPWSGEARGAFDQANTKLIGRMVRLGSYLLRQERVLGEAGKMLRTTRRALETLLGQLDAAERQLLAQSRAVPAAAVARLEQEAVNSAGRFVQGARAQRDALAKYLAALADRLDREAAAEADARERAKCPFTHRFGGSLERVIAENEGRRARSYDDANKIRTIGVGFNMERADSPAIVAKVLTAHPGTFSAADINSGQAFQDLFHQRAVLDEAQISALFRYTFAEARRIVTDRGVKNFDSLPAPVQAALVDTAFQRPANINRIAADINQGDYVAAADYLERWGAQIAAKDPQGLGGVKGRTERNGAMLRNLC